VPVLVPKTDIPAIGSDQFAARRTFVGEFRLVAFDAEWMRIVQNVPLLR
jgi:hypothetical protein